MARLAPPCDVGYRLDGGALTQLLARLPAVHVLAGAAAGHGDAPRWAVVEAARRASGERREAILGGRGDPAVAAIEPREVAADAAELARPRRAG